MKILVMPDVHLKPKMFDQADELLEKGVAERAVVLGDLVDDWGEEFNLPLYTRTMQRAIKFHKDHPNTLWCLGNHDWGYYHPEFGKRESGHSRFAEGEMLTWLDEFERVGIIQAPIIFLEEGKCLFSHAGVNKNWVGRHSLRPTKNTDFSEEWLWEEDSPIWWRPQTEYGGNPDEAWGDYFQVVGHSPVKTPTQEGSILSCDTFSTYRNGAPYGDQSFVVVDTITKKWEKVKYER